MSIYFCHGYKSIWQYIFILVLYILFAFCYANLIKLYQTASIMQNYFAFISIFLVQHFYRLQTKHGK